MRQNELLDAFQDIIQSDIKLEPDMNLQELEEWDSLAYMAMAAFFDSKLGKPITFENLDKCVIVADLLKLAQQ